MVFNSTVPNTSSTALPQSSIRRRLFLITCQQSISQMRGACDNKNPKQVAYQQQRSHECFQLKELRFSVLPCVLSRPFSGTIHPKVSGEDVNGFFNLCSICTTVPCLARKSNLVGSFPENRMRSDVQELVIESRKFQNQMLHQYLWWPRG